MAWRSTARHPKAISLRKTPNFEPRLGTIGIVIVHEDGGILTGKLRGKNHMQLLMAQGGEGVRPLGALALVAGPSY